MNWIRDMRSLRMQVRELRRWLAGTVKRCGLWLTQSLLSRKKIAEVTNRTMTADRTATVAHPMGKIHDGDRQARGVTWDMANPLPQLRRKLLRKVHHQLGRPRWELNMMGEPAESK